MAINRSIITWDEFFQAKDYTEIYRMLVTNYKAIYGSDINLAVNTAEGEFIRFLANILYDFSELAFDTYNSIDVNNAKGKLLDNLVLLSANLIRKKESNTKLRATLSWVGDGIKFLDNDIIIAEDINGSYWNIKPFDINDLDTSEVDPLMQPGILVSMESLIFGEFFIPKDQYPILEIRRNANFVSVEDITVNNIILDVRGSIAETDAHLRARKKESLSFNSTSLIDSIRDEILNNIFSVDDVKIYSSVGATPLNIPLWNGTDLISGGVTIPKHDVFVLVKPQEDVEIAQNGVTSKAIADVLKRKITLGISTMQANIDANYRTEIIQLDSVFSDYTETYRYYISQPYNPHIRINYSSTSGGFNAAATLSRIREALYRLAKDYPINRNINVTELANVAFNAGNLDPLNPTFTIDSVWIELDSAPITASSETTVNNGYWYVDGINDVKITLVESS